MSNISMPTRQACTRVEGEPATAAVLLQVPVHALARVGFLQASDPLLRIICGLSDGVRPVMTIADRANRYRLCLP